MVFPPEPPPARPAKVCRTLCNDTPRCVKEKRRKNERASRRDHPSRLQRRPPSASWSQSAGGDGAVLQIEWFWRVWKVGQSRLEMPNLPGLTDTPAAGVIGSLAE